MEPGIRVRYAPSPTGHLHIGNARTALFNYLFARRHHGKFIIRIEDTDVKRNVEGGEQNQLHYLRWLGIDWDEGVDCGGEYGPYRQTERLSRYTQYAKQLIAQGDAYYCYCTEEELEREREQQSARGEMPIYSGKHRNTTEEQRQAYEAEGRKPTIRFRVPAGRIYSFEDQVKGAVSFESDGIGDFVIVKKDGIPTYNFAVTVDDHLMRISHVLRGDDHISNTPRQLMIYEALGWNPPHYGHMTLIVNEHRKKLSKRDESIIQFIEQYEGLGYLPEALFNFIALLGWSPEGEQEIFSREQLVQQFDESRLSKSPALFDTNKLNWLNNEYIKRLPPDELVELAVPHLRKAGYIPASLAPDEFDWVSSLIGLYQEQLICISEIVPLTALFFEDEAHYDSEGKEVLAEEHVPVVLRNFRHQIEQLPDKLAVEDFKLLLKRVQAETGFKGKQLYMPVRVAITGQTHGRDLNHTLYLLGKDNLIRRLQNLERLMPFEQH